MSSVDQKIRGPSPQPSKPNHSMEEVSSSQFSCCSVYDVVSWTSEYGVLSEDQTSVEICTNLKKINDIFSSLVKKTLDLVD